MRTPGTITRTRIFVPSMDCPDEEKEIRAALSRLPAVESLTFHLFSRQVEVHHRGEMEPILAVLRRIGMEGHPLDDALRRAALPSSDKGPRNTFLLSGAALLLGAGARILFPGESLVRLPFLASILLGGAPVALRGFREVRNRSLGMNALMTISIVGAALLGEGTEAAVVVTLFALANTLEARTLDRARRATADLFASSPERAVVRVGGPGGEERIVPAEEVRPGDTLVIRPGERVPVDAVIRRGASDLNESVLTGESVPVEKKEGEELFAGTVNGRGLLIAEATRPLSESTYARILRRVEEAQAQKAPVQTFMERFAAAYTPAVLCAAVLVAAVPSLLGGPALDWAYRALVMLVIACPCAIVLAAPVVTLSALTRATREGILVKGARHLEAMGAIRAVAFDKTGTLTRGRLRVTRVRAADGWTEEEVLRLAGAVEAASAHPAAVAIRREAGRRGVATAARGTLARTFEPVEGQGVAAEVEGRKIHVGNRRMFEAMGLGGDALERLLEHRGSAAPSVAIVGTRDTLAGAVEMEDELRPEAAEAIRALRDLGVAHIVLLTGDNAEAARKAGAAAGIDIVEHGLLPDDKLARIRDLVASHGSAAMVGDGVNDAPALALATVGVAIAAAGSPAAMETADVALMTGDLRRIPSAVALGRRMVSLVRQNVAASLAIKAVFLAMAVAGYASLWMAVLADMGTTLLVIFNGLRLLRARDV
jgi:Cd2+/Zn2+-exporting ATPase